MVVQEDTPDLESFFSPGVDFAACEDCYDAWAARGHQGSMMSLLVYAPPKLQPCEHLRQWVADMVAAGKCSPEFAAVCAALESGHVG